jgi:hypothetical protein
MLLKIVLEILLSNKNGVQELLYLEISGLHVCEDLTNEVNRLLERECTPLLLPFDDEHQTDHQDTPSHVEQERLLVLRRD